MSSAFIAFRLRPRSLNLHILSHPHQSLKFSPPFMLRLALKERKKEREKTKTTTTKKKKKNPQTLYEYNNCVFPSSCFQSASKLVFIMSCNSTYYHTPPPFCATSSLITYKEEKRDEEAEEGKGKEKKIQSLQTTRKIHVFLASFFTLIFNVALRFCSLFPSPLSFSLTTNLALINLPSHPSKF